MHKPKLSQSQIQMILESKESCAVVADRLDRARSTICRIKNGWTYKKEHKHAKTSVGVSP